MRRWLLFLLVLSLSGCGYRWGRGEIAHHSRSICIPYVEGDREGILTRALIHAVTSKGVFSYRSSGSDLVLRVCLMKPEDVNIGFDYAPECTGALSSIIVSNEARLTCTAVVRLFDRCTGTCVWGPHELSASLSYDFEPDLSHVDFHAFSLGQLERHNLALDAATPSLYALLAEKIVNYIAYGW